jgi:hypothetical protein
MFEFIKDRKPQGTISGQFRPLADQTKFRSIWGVVDGPQIGPWTGDMIEAGEIYSGDGKARLGGTAVKTKGDKFHDVKSGNTTFREYQVPIDAVEKWNKYEAKQGNDQVRGFTEAARKKALDRGFSDPEGKLEIEHIDVTPEAILAAQSEIPEGEFSLAGAEAKAAAAAKAANKKAA